MGSFQWFPAADKTPPVEEEMKEERISRWWFSF
jgi:hypothetical protein